MRSQNSPSKQYGPTVKRYKAAGQKRSRALQLVAHFLLIFCSSLLLTQVVLPPLQQLWSDWGLIFENLFPIWALTFLIYCICGRVFSTIAFVSLLTFGLRYLHDTKISILEAPLISSDALLWDQVFASPDLVVNYIGWPTILGAGFFMLMLFILYSRETPVARIRDRAIALTVLLLAFIPMRTTLGVYYMELPQHPWEPDPSLRQVGMVAYLIQDYLNIRAKRTPAANEMTIAAFKANHPLSHPTARPDPKSDIILWLGESFFDPRIFRDINSCELIPTFCELARKNINGSITVPAFGGETVRTEFEILTGIPMSAVAEHHYPYVSLTNVPVNSIAWELRTQGYETIAVHNHQRRFWGRPVALKNLGFQRWIGVREMKEPKLIGRYHADSMLTDAVIDLLQLTSERPPQLIFAISMQAHGPYGNQPGLPEDQVEAIAVPKALQAKDAHTLQQYFYHLNSADVELQRLSAYIQSRERPTLVLYFGDHLPGLGHVYQDIEFDNGLDAGQQKTPFLLFANYPLRITGEPTLDIAAWQLATLTLKVADLLGDGAFAWFDALYEQQKWSQETAGECQTSVCDTLLQFQYQQLAGPKSEPSGPPLTQDSHFAK